MRYLLIAAVVAFGIMVFTVVDIAIIERSRVRHLPKAVWIVLAVALSVLGSVLWFFFGRERRGTGSPAPSARPVLGPDDDSEFLDRLAREQEREERIRDLERRLSELDDDKPKE